MARMRRNESTARKPSSVMHGSSSDNKAVRHFIQRPLRSGLSPVGANNPSGHGDPSARCCPEAVKSRVPDGQSSTYRILLLVGSCRAGLDNCRQSQKQIRVLLLRCIIPLGPEFIRRHTTIGAWNETALEKVSAVEPRVVDQQRDERFSFRRKGSKIWLNSRKGGALELHGCIE